MKKVPVVKFTTPHAAAELAGLPLEATARRDPHQPFLASGRIIVDLDQQPAVSPAARLFSSETPSDTCRSGAPTRHRQATTLSGRIAIGGHDKVATGGQIRLSADTAHQPRQNHQPRPARHAQTPPRTSPPSQELLVSPRQPGHPRPGRYQLPRTLLPSPWTRATKSRYAPRCSSESLKVMQSNRRRGMSSG